MIYADDEAKPQLPYLGADPRLRGGAESFARLTASLERGSAGADLAQRAQAERASLLQCGKEGWRLDPEALHQALGPRFGGGNEHDVFFDEATQRVIKITLSATGYGAQGDALSYLKNLDRSNRFFADAIRFEGLVAVTPTFDAIVSSQPFIRGRKATEAEIEGYFSELGYRLTSAHCFEQSDPSGRRWAIADARPDNIIYESNSELVLPIDVQILSLKKSL